MENLPNIFWSSEAVRNLDTILQYLALKWTEREVSIFKKKLEKVIFLIATRPELFPISSQRKQIRRCVLTKQTSVYYQAKQGKILIVSVFDNRQDPTKLD